MPPTPGSPAERPLLLDPNLHVVFSVTLMAVLGVASVTPAFPAIADRFGLTPGKVGLLVAVFTVPGVVLTPVAGVLGDRLGRKRILVPALLLFAVAGTACGFVRDFDLLLALRFVQGVGAAALGVINLTIIGDLYQGLRRPEAMGYNAGVLSIGTAVYPAVGGGLTLLGWYYPFFLPVLALPVAGLVLLRLRSPEPRFARPLGDYLRAVATTVRNWEAVGLFVASLVTFVIIYGAFSTYLPFVLAQKFTSSPAEIGALLSATSVATAVTAFRLGRISRRFTGRALILTGFGCYAGTMAAVPLADSVWTVLGLMLVFGAANGICIPTILAALMDIAPAELRGAFMAVNGSLLRAGQTLGPLVAALLLGWRDLSAVYYGNALLAVAAFVTVAAVVPGRLRVESTEEGLTS